MSFVKYPRPCYVEVQISTKICVIEENNHNDFKCNYNPSNTSAFITISSPSIILCNKENIHKNIR